VPLITAEGLSKGYGGHTLFDDATFQIEAGDKVALVGPNGAGKSTLLRILAGREKTDHGTFRFTGVRVHWFDQHPAIPAGATVRSLLTAAKPVPPALQKRKDALEARISEPSLYEQPGFEAVLEEYAELEREIKVQTTAGPAESAIMGQLGVLDLDQSAASLSGGEKTRVFLARTLQAVRSGDMVVLDEPTNHLDVDSIEWLEDWIQAFDGTVLLVAHDRAFLDTVATRVFEVKQGRITCYVGNYEDYIAARDEDIERARREHAKAEDRVQSAKATIQQFRHQKRFDGQYASRMKALDKYKAALERTPDPVLEKLGFGLAFGAVEKVSNEMLRMTGLHKSYNEPVLKGLDLELKKGDRLGLVGANGAGKSTLLRILTGREKKDAGTLHVAPAVKGAHPARGGPRRARQSRGAGRQGLAGSLPLQPRQRPAAHRQHALRWRAPTHDAPQVRAQAEQPPHPRRAHQSPGLVGPRRRHRGPQRLPRHARRGEPRPIPTGLRHRDHRRPR
jgi:ATPase subunit of ABC transporter with duplicated ATPase domains